MERAPRRPWLATLTMLALLAGAPVDSRGQGLLGEAARSGAAGVDPRISGAVDAVRIDSLMATVRVLAGVDEFVLAGQSRRIDRRNDGGAGNELAADYLAARLARYGLEVVQPTFGSTGRNVIAVQRPPEGTTESPGIFMISAHYDAVLAAPGADDNASGTAAVLEAARILSRVALPHVVMYALWDAEENGLVGSDRWAKAAAAEGMDFRGLVNADMIAWDGNGDLRYSTSETEGWPGIETVLRTTSTALGLGLRLESSQSVGSDHRPFTRIGFRAITLIEALNDFNPYYHKPTDTPAILKPDYFERMTRLAVAVFAQQALDAVISTAVEPDVDLQVPAMALEHWPEPAADAVALRFVMPEASAPTITVYDLLGREVERLAPGHLPAGEHIERLATADWPVGVYVVRLQAGRAAASRFLTVRR